ncbi:MAG: NAD(P)/FAD-dependent oxidoreductase [Candidatus Omnitrophota bacterium]
MDNKKIVVVGGGPAGMMAAIKAGELIRQVTLIEKNPILGRKLLLSGKGRCNLTNTCDLDSFIKRFTGNGQFLRDAFKKFFNLELMRFFEKRGLKLKIERQLRVFPQTDSSVSVAEILKKELLKNGVQIIYKSVVKDIFTRDNTIKGLSLADGRVIAADKVILATGGVSYGFTGSTGEGLKLAGRLGHRIVPFRPGLVPLEARQHYPKLLEGVTLKNIRLRFSDTKKEISSEIGELMFTGFGISGPLVLSLSGRIADWFKPGSSVYVEIDLKPALSREQLHARLLREFKANPRKNIKNTLKSLLPARLVDLFIDIARVPEKRQASQVTLKEREALVSLFKGMRLDIVRPRPIEDAMVTRGGVSLKDINPRTMESRLIKGLYFAGEIIDVDADTGGFNLQAAFSTGYLAGESAALL